MSENPVEITEAHAAPAVASVGLWRILGAFLWLGCTSFGGGSAGWLYREMVLKRRWIDDRIFLAAMALAQVMPGANGVKLSVLIGQQLRGGPGAAVAVLGLLAGPFAIILLIGGIYARVSGSAVLHAMLDGIAATVVGLTFATGLRSAWHGAGGVLPLAVTAVTVLCVGVLRWPMLPVILMLAPLSIGFAFLEGRRRHA
ncbi:MAG TPA: chromate transporter [Stellaceae bacterium]